MEAFVLVLYLSSGLLFVPGFQSVRVLVRAIPYLGSLALLGYDLAHGVRPRTWPGRQLLTVSLLLYPLGLFNPESNFVAGLAQCVFQLSIAAPAYWVMAMPIGPARLERLLKLIFLANAASSAVGLLQVLYPDQFMPPEFSRQISADGLEAMRYMTASGQTIVRPPGLTDLPGGVCVHCANTALLGILLGFMPGVGVGRRVACIGLAGMALVTLYMTQVRSILMMTAVGYAVMCVLLLRQRRLWLSGMLAGAGTGMVIGAFALAVAIGGESVFNRFYGLIDTGLVTSYQQNRGLFVEYTFRELIFEYPLGAGIGRWGMMNAHFAQFDSNPSPPLWAEIQVTGWLIDGGILLMVAYTGAILAAMWSLYRLAHPDRGGRLAYPSAVVFSLGLFAIGQANAGPAFNTTIGMQFWFTCGIVFAVAARGIRSERRPAVERTGVALSEVPRVG